MIAAINTSRGESISHGLANHPAHLGYSGFKNFMYTQAGPTPCKQIDLYFYIFQYMGWTLPVSETERHL